MKVLKIVLHICLFPIFGQRRGTSRGGAQWTLELSTLLMKGGGKKIEEINKKVLPLEILALPLKGPCVFPIRGPIALL